MVCSLDFLLCCGLLLSPLEVDVWLIFELISIFCMFIAIVWLLITDKRMEKRGKELSEFLNRSADIQKRYWSNRYQLALLLIRKRAVQNNYDLSRVSAEHLALISEVELISEIFSIPAIQVANEIKNTVEEKNEQIVRV